MKKTNDQEINLFRFIERVRDEADNSIVKGKSAEEYQKAISDMCIKCFKSAEDIERCEICNSHTTTTNDQLFLNFEGLDGDDD